MINWIKGLFCGHEWSQRYWGTSECAYVCTKCGTIQYRKGPGGPMPEGTSRPSSSSEVQK